MNGESIQLKSEVKIRLVDEIEIYFESLNQVKKRIDDWLLAKDLEELPGSGRVWRLWMEFSTFLAIASIAPIIPSATIYALSILSPEISLWNIKIVGSPAQYLIAWIGMSVVAAANLWITMNRHDRITAPKFDQEKPPFTITKEQLLFFRIHKAYKELRAYFVSQIDIHVENAIKELRAIDKPRSKLTIQHDVGETVEVKSVIPKAAFPDVNGDAISAWQNSISLGNMPAVASSFLTCFRNNPLIQLPPETEARLMALATYMDKIVPRLKARDDVDEVLLALQSLSEAIYYMLPIHQIKLSDSGLDALRDKGRDSFHIFASIINRMPEMRVSEPNETIPPQSDHTRKMLWKLIMQHPIALFFELSLFLGIFSIAMMYVAVLKYPTLSGDIIVPTVIGASVTGAAALVPLLRKNIGS